MTLAGNLDIGSIGDRLRGERMRLRLTQAELAARAGKTKGTMQTWEADEANPNAVALAAFAEAGADVLFIITGRRSHSARPLNSSLASVVVQRTLGMLDAPERHRVLLEVLAGELRG